MLRQISRFHYTSKLTTLSSILSPFNDPYLYPRTLVNNWDAIKITEHTLSIFRVYFIPKVCANRYIFYSVSHKISIDKIQCTAVSRYRKIADLVIFDFAILHLIKLRRVGSGYNNGARITTTKLLLKIIAGADTCLGKHVSRDVIYSRRDRTRSEGIGSKPIRRSHSLHRVTVAYSREIIPNGTYMIHKLHSSEARLTTLPGPVGTFCDTFSSSR